MFDLTLLGERRPRLPLQRKVKQVRRIQRDCVRDMAYGVLVKDIERYATNMCILR